MTAGDKARLLLQLSPGRLGLSPQRPWSLNGLRAVFGIRPVWVPVWRIRKNTRSKANRLVRHWRPIYQEAPCLSGEWAGCNTEALLLSSEPFIHELYNSTWLCLPMNPCATLSIQVETHAFTLTLHAFHERDMSPVCLLRPRYWTKQNHPGPEPTEQGKTSRSKQL